MTKSQYTKLFDKAAKHFNIHQVNGKVTKSIPNYEQFSNICDALINSNHNDIDPNANFSIKYPALNALMLSQPSVDDLLNIEL